MMSLDLQSIVISLDLISLDLQSFVMSLDVQSIAQVDVESPDLTKYPEFSRAEAREFLLHPGQTLYIPPRCWHYVRSIDISFSVSFWWD